MSLSLVSFLGYSIFVFLVAYLLLSKLFKDNSKESLLLNLEGCKHPQPHVELNMGEGKLTYFQLVCAVDGLLKFIVAESLNNNDASTHDELLQELRKSFKERVGD